MVEMSAIMKPFISSKLFIRTWILYVHIKPSYWVIIYFLSIYFCVTLYNAMAKKNSVFQLYEKVISLWTTGFPLHFFYLIVKQDIKTINNKCIA